MHGHMRLAHKEANVQSGGGHPCDGSLYRSPLERPRQGDVPGHSLFSLEARELLLNRLTALCESMLQTGPRRLVAFLIPIGTGLLDTSITKHYVRNTNHKRTHSSPSSAMHAHHHRQGSIPEESTASSWCSSVRTPPQWVQCGKRRQLQPQACRHSWAGLRRQTVYLRLRHPRNQPRQIATHP